MKNYFYTHEAKDDKIYVFWNNNWLNQLMYFGGRYFWVSLNECKTNWNCTTDGHQTLKDAIEDIMEWGHDVYQLDTLEDLAEFIAEKENE